MSKLLLTGDYMHKEQFLRVVLWSWHKDSSQAGLLYVRPDEEGPDWQGRSVKCPAHREEVHKQLQVLVKARIHI